MKAARKLVEFFNKSSQSQANLLSIQEILFVNQPALKPIQDVVTRWWSTYSMLERLLGRLHEAIVALKKTKQHLDFELLNYLQIKVLQEVQVLLQPILKAQRHLESDSYSTLSQVTILIDKVRTVLKDSSAPKNESYSTA